jgi:hypothetical protein
MSEGASVAPGWYDDPAGSGAQRWWGGSEWTEHLRAREPEPAPSNPFVSEGFNPYGVGPQQYNPMALHQRPGDNSQSHYVPAAPADNSKGWISLAAGVASLILLAVGNVVGAVVVGTATAVVVAITYGVRSLAARNAGQSSSLVPPVLGMLLAALTVLIFVGSLLAPAVLDASYDNEAYDLSFTDNPELEAMYDTANQIQLQLYARRDGSWPTELVADASGSIVLDGAVIGRLSPGQTFTYQTTEGGQHFTFTIAGGVLGQSVVFDSQTEEISVWCYNTDVSCGD